MCKYGLKTDFTITELRSKDREFQKPEEKKSSHMREWSTKILPPTGREG